LSLQEVEESLESTEQNNSFFEKAVRLLGLPACKAFLRDGQVMPVNFVPYGGVVTTPARQTVARLFPKTLAGATLMLAADGANPRPRPGLRVAALFSGGPASGGHNVIVGLKRILKGNTLLGVRGGPAGLLAGDLFEIQDGDLPRLANTGGFDFLGTDRTRIRTKEQLGLVENICLKHSLDAIVIIGGDDSNTNAVTLAEHLFSVYPDGKGVQVIGVPKTMDGDLQYGHHLPVSFGFDTATKVYSELVGNILQDTLSSRKYWHFIRLMGRTASHVTLEVALQTKPTVTLIAEELSWQRRTLRSVVDEISHAVITRSASGKDYGVVLVPEGLLEAIPEVGELLEQIDIAIARHAADIAAMPLDQRARLIAEQLDADKSALFRSLPGYMQETLVADRDAHGNLRVSQIQTEILLGDLVTARVAELSSDTPLAINHHFFGYEGRCGVPTRFDAAFCYNLGLTAGSLVLDGRTGYMASVTDLDKGGVPVAIPLPGMLHEEERDGKTEVVIQKALVTQSSPAFRFFAARREQWMRDDRISSPGPRQLWGTSADQLPFTVALNQGYDSLRFRF